MENQKKSGMPQAGPHEREEKGSRRDPEERAVSNPKDAKEKSLDKTLADSFPTSDPPSTIPDPAEDENAA